MAGGIQPGDLPPCAVLRRMYETRSIELPDGRRLPTTSGISREYAAALYRLIRQERPQQVIETGMGHGFSTLTILCALEEWGGRLISIDPYQDWESGMQAALHAVERAGYAGRHRFIRQKSSEALPALLAGGIRIQMGYIDGSHLFEDAFIDFYYLDRMLEPGGILGFNNCGWPDVYRVIRYLQKHRVYEEVDVGLRPDYSARRPLLCLVRRLLRWPRQDRYFRKTDRSGGSLAQA